MPTPLTATSFDVDAVRADFPALHQTVYDDRPLVYLDNGATSQKPQVVIDRLTRYYAEENSNIHRGVHVLSQQATEAYEAARVTTARYLNANAHEIVFTRGTTESINLVAQSFARPRLKPGDEIVVSAMEHHSNIVPWQLVADQTGARLRVIPVDEAGVLDYDAYLTLLTERTRLVALVHVSNALGTVNPVGRMIADAHGLGIPVLIDGAQATPHGPVDVQALDADFYCFSSHKVYGPTGFGVLYGKEQHLEAMPPWQGGGDMIEQVSFERTTFNEVPHKFEAGTPHIAGGMGLDAALRYVMDLDADAIAAHEADLLAYATEQLATIDGLRLIGTAPDKVPICSFLVGDAHPYDIGTIVDRLGVAVRTGHHCTQPLMRRYGIPGTVRASFAFYNTRGDVDRLVDGVRQAQRMLQ